jgi:hypothetical protein
MTVVSDTTPLNYLLAIKQVHILPELLETVLIPEKVKRELCSQGAPEINRQWIDALPKDYLVNHADVPVRVSQMRLNGSPLVTPHDDLHVAWWRTMQRVDH